MTTGNTAVSAAKPVDAWWTVLVIDPIAIPIVRRLEHVRRVTPNHITVASIGLGVLSAVLFFLGEPLWAAIAFELRFLLDCIDGKLARLRGTSSRLGAFLDVCGDIGGIALIYVAFGSWLLQQELVPAWAVLALAALSVYHYFVWVLLQREQVQTVSAAPGGLRGRLARHRLGLRPRAVDIESLLLFVVPIINVPIGYQIGVAVAVAFYLLNVAQHTAKAIRITAAADRYSDARVVSDQ